MTEILGQTVYFPVTVLTNVLLGVVCIFQYNMLKKRKVKWWPLFFLFLGVSTFFAAYGHGYSMDLRNPFLFVSRIFSIVSVFFAVTGSIHYLPKRRVNSFLIGFALIKAAIFIIWLILDNTFFPVKYHAILGLGLMVTGVHLYRIKGKLGEGNGWILLGIVVISLAAVVHGLKISLSDDWFNYNDISHLVMILGLVCMVRGIKMFKYAPSK
jgi:hypothetical protein